ncbi:MAG TPA: Ku protein [Polyangiaceae bacterium]|jgi:DNA end-binding protein Ku
MAARATSSGTISFGLVSIPVKFYTAAASEQASFNMLHKKCGGRVKQQYICPTDNNEVVERTEMIKGYEYARGQYVQFTDEELKALESERSNSIEISEFVPIDTVDFVQVEKTYYLGPDKGGDKAYRLLSESMTKKEMVAVGRWGSRGKEQLVLIRPYGKDGIILHQLYYATEVRAFDEIDTGATFKFSDKEHELAEKLIDQLSTEQFEPEKYSDSYSTRVNEAVQQKVEGKEITIAPEAPKAQIIDLFEALKKSLASTSKADNATEKGEAPIRPPKKTAPKAEKSEPKKTRAKG